MPSLMKKINLLRGILNGNKAFCGPFFVDIDVTNRCNMNCLGCQYHSSETRGLSSSDPSTGHISMALIEQLASELKSMGTHEVILTGEGEPLLHPRIFDIIRIMKSNHLDVQLFTNGTLLNAENRSALIQSGLDILKISFWADNEKEYGYFYPGVNSDKFNVIMSSIRALTAEKKNRGANSPKVIITGPLTRYNSRSLSDRVNLAAEMNCDGIALNPYKHWGGEFRQAALTGEELADLIPALKAMRESLNSRGLSHNLDDMITQIRLGEKAWLNMSCFVGWYSSRIRSDGMVMPCCRCYNPLGSLNEKSFAEIWKSQDYGKLRRTGRQTGGMKRFSDSCACDWCIYAVNNNLIESTMNAMLPRPVLRRLRHSIKPEKHQA